jgi:hypothetical protein
MTAKKKFGFSRGAGPALLIWALAGCSSARGREPAARPVLIAQRCPPLIASAPTSGASKKFLIEIAQVSSEDLKEPVATWLAEHPVGVRSVAQLVVTLDQVHHLPWTRCQNVGCTLSQQGTLEIVPRAASSDPGALELQVTFTPTSAQESAASASIAMHDQQAALVEFARSPAPGWSLVMTSYQLNDERALQQMLECKRAGRASGG